MNIYVFTTHIVDDCEDLGITNKLFYDKQAALNALKEWRDDEIKYVNENGWEIAQDEPSYFEAYEDGYYCTNHSLGRVWEEEIK